MNDQLNDLARTLGERLLAAGWWAASAESCTGGLIGHAITDIAGSSAYYRGGIIAYHNAVKQGVLGVTEATLQAHGAVSEPCAREMVAGVRRLLATDIAVATTGIAGPGGGSIEKPVGLVYIAVASPDSIVCERHIFAGDRATIKLATAQRALELVLSVVSRQ